MNESTLMHGYRAMPSPEPLRKERCVCGGMLVAPRNDEERIRFEVERHRATGQHRLRFPYAS